MGLKCEIMTITPEQHEIHLKQLAYFQGKVDDLIHLTRKYHYDHEAERVHNRKQDSEQYYKLLNQNNETQHLDND